MQKTIDHSANAARISLAICAGAALGPAPVYAHEDNDHAPSGSALFL
jgi:hypothetical protein